jgi:hypothetical protein
MPLFSRRDGDPVPDVPPYRRMMQLLMRKRSESFVFFEQKLDVSRTLEWLVEKNAGRTGEDRLNFFHLVTHAIVETLGERPRLNRFTMGGRLYQRRGIFISFSAKKAMDDAAPVFVVKREFQPGWDVAQVAEAARGGTREGRSDKPTHVDKELSLFLKLPLFALSPLVRLVMWLDQVNVLPYAFYKDDPLYASVFVANLGSIGLDAAFHHAYEYGNVSIFVTIGKLQEVPYVKPDGTLGARPELTLRWTLDERIEDGLYCARALELVRARVESPR